MDVMVNVADDKGDSGLTQLREATLMAPAPFHLSIHHPGRGRVRLQMDMVSDCSVGAIEATGPTGFRALRTPALIHRSDPELVYLAMSKAGLVGIGQDRADVLLRPGQLTIYDTSRPYDGECRPSGTSSTWGIFVGVARDRLPVRAQRLRGLTASVLRVPDPLSRLVTTCVHQIAADASGYSPAVAANVASVVVDLIATLLAAVGGSAPPLDTEGQRRMLLMQAKVHIDQHLPDPDLSPATVAAALHVSLRTLYRAFDEQHQAAATWIRRRRLERCRRDLIDPAQMAVPVHALATKWGFTHASQFGRAFRQAYGMSPDAYRRARPPLT
jgi:AraC-like DNA-binding protein